MRTCLDMVFSHLLNSTNKGTGSRGEKNYLFIYLFNLKIDWLIWLKEITWLENFHRKNQIQSLLLKMVWKPSVNFYWMSYIYTLLYAGTQVSDCQEHRMGSCGYWLVYPSAQQSSHWSIYFWNGSVYPHWPTLVSLNGSACPHTPLTKFQTQFLPFYTVLGIFQDITFFFIAF